MISYLLSLAALAAFAAVVLAWLFRSSAAPLWAKIAGPSIAVAAACSLFFTTNAILGYPVSASMADMPETVQLVAFVPHDEAKLVDLWVIIPPRDTPRSYQVKLDQQLKQTLRDAREAMEHGQVAILTKGAKGKGKGTGKGGDAGKGPGSGHSGAGDRLGIGDDAEMYFLDPSAMTSLPAKD